MFKTSPAMTVALAVLGLISTVPTSMAAPPCPPGMVPRGIAPPDPVCVYPNQRDRVRAEDNAAISRREPNGGAYGFPTCRPGYVWRNALTNDTVCVTPEARTLAANENVANTIRYLGCSLHMVECRAAANLRQRALDLQNQIIEKEYQVDAAKAAAAKRQAAQAAAARKRPRDNSGQSETVSAITVDNITPLQNDIKDLQTALDAAQREADAAAERARAAK
jgi:hypothetical protein